MNLISNIGLSGVRYRGILGGTIQDAFNTLLRSGLARKYDESSNMSCQNLLDEIAKAAPGLSNVSLSKTVHGDEFVFDTCPADIGVSIRISQPESSTEQLNESMLMDVEEIDCAFLSTVDKDVLEFISKRKIKRATFISPRLPYQSDTLHLAMGYQSLMSQIIPYSSALPTGQFSHRSIAMGESMTSAMVIFRCQQSELYRAAIIRSAKISERGAIARSLHYFM